MKKKISALIVDGKEYTVTDDNKYVEGRGKRRTIDEFIEEKGKSNLILVIPPNVDEEGAVYGFSNKKNHKEWLIENKLHKNYDREQRILEKARRDLLPEETERITKEVKEATEMFGKFLAEHNLKANEIEKIQKLREEPYLAGPSHSVILYDRLERDPTGSYIVLPGGGYGCGKHYNNLGAHSFNNKTSSFTLTCSQHVKIFADYNYQGISIDSFASQNRLDVWWLWFGMLNNQVSSVIVY